jgi:hypothetical protein
MKSAPPLHFEGKSPQEHIKEARLKGWWPHLRCTGVMPAYCGLCRLLKDTATLLLVVWAMGLNLITFDLAMQLMILLSLGWAMWKPLRSAMLGWGRLERLHRLIEEERWEIDHNREQEKSELRAMYEVKGFSGKLLDEIVDILMSDDNRLLQIMLQEELGLTLEIHEHPLKQAFGAFVGAVASSMVLILCFMYCPAYIFPIATAGLIAIGSYTFAKLRETKKAQVSFGTYAQWVWLARSCM